MARHPMASVIQLLRREKEVIEIKEEIDPYLEMAAVHRAVFKAGGPALYFSRVRGSKFPCISNLFGSERRCQLLFRHSWQGVAQMIRLKGDPIKVLQNPQVWFDVILAAMRALPMPSLNAPVLRNNCSKSELPGITCWPKDGGPFITLPQVYSRPIGGGGPLSANCGMYRIQLSGNEYLPDEVGLHYQIHRGIGVHHQQHLAQGKNFPVTIAVGGHPAYAMAAVMPLPEGLPEAALAGALSGAPFRYAYWRKHLIPAQADFALVGNISVNGLKPEGPFGDHLGYYSLTHDFPVLKLEKIFHRPNAIWPFTVVGRPPQEDSFFGSMIHKLTEPMVRHITSGLRDLHAVDEAGVHPLLLAIGSERYVPYEVRQPREILTQANAILGFGQCSLAKFLLIVAQEDHQALKAHDTYAFFQHLLERVDWRRDLHFQTQTTMDTLDYSGTALNAGSKVVIAAAGVKRRVLATETGQLTLPWPWTQFALVAPGILAISGPSFTKPEQAEQDRQTLANHFAREQDHVQGLPFLVLCDDASSLKGNFKEFLWQAFTRTNPSHDIDGVDSFTRHKHWGCNGALLLDARSKPHHAPTLEDDPVTTLKIQRFFRSGAVLAPWSHGL